ncbi:MAG TPA: hypothetical protein VGO52_27020 [Hyphomonadaceae bacterium]|jgi:hypothetical protein|nr:hypothetical protein [Hyphomonadaceae bacterium]
MKTTLKTSLRLALTALAVSGITFAASGKPLPFLAKAQPAEAVNPVLLPPGTLDGQTPGEAIAANRATSATTSFSLN